MSTDAPKTVLVTGAAGYVGGALVRRLLADGETRVIGVDAAEMAHGVDGVREILDHPRLEFVRGDVRDTAALLPLLRRADAVVHLAAIVGDPAGRRDPDLTRAVNVDASIALADAAAENEVGHFIFVSTCSNYGVSDAGTLVGEDADLNPVSLYAETKVAVERYLSGKPDFPYTVLRLATVYGVAPRMRFDLTVNQFTMEAFAERALSIYGEQFWRPYVHVEDVGRAIEMVLDTPRLAIGQTFNVGDSDENYTKGILYELLKQRLPDLEAEFVSVEEDPRSYKVSFRKVADTLGFEVSRRVPDGVDEVLKLAELGAFSDFRDSRFRN
ncbi:MAG: NAD-dependent epimerase/dehydratase family protein [Thermoleophilia bacterium]